MGNPVINVTNVFEYVSTYFNLKFKTMGEVFRDLFNIMPPFEIFDIILEYPDKSGYILSFNLSSPFSDNTLHHGLMIDFYVSHSTKRIFSLLFIIDNKGNIIYEDGYPFKISPSEHLVQMYPVSYQDKLWDLYPIVYVALLSIQFMHCKNVTLIENDPNKNLKSGVKKHWEKKGKLPLKKYYTLNITPLKEILKEEGNIKQNGLKKSLHICRGHFRTYDEKPLFGRVKGTFWIPQHIKGDKSEGVIIKDYNIKL